MLKRIVFFLLISTLVGCVGKIRNNDQKRMDSVRIYDVEPQEEAHEDLMCMQHYARMGVMTHIDNYEKKTAPFVKQIKEVEKEMGIDIEYIVLDNWEELQQEEKNFQDANVTEIILFNNSYEESLIKEITSGKYADLQVAMEEAGLYNGELYNQIVLESGMLEGKQLLIPLLYNVSGMIHGENNGIEYSKWVENMQKHLDEANISFEEFICMLNEAMHQTDIESMEVPYISGAFLDGNIDLFLLASGIQWETEHNQRELFDILHKYLKTYQITQIESKQMEAKEDRLSNADLYAQYLNLNQKQPLFDLVTREILLVSDDMIDKFDLRDYDSTIPSEQLYRFRFVESMLKRTRYFVECTAADNVAYHSVFGLLAYRNHYINLYTQIDDFEILNTGEMYYWPIGVLEQEEKYAAQPICYAAILKDGDTQLGVKVIESLLNQKIDVKYGISLCEKIKDEQLDSWRREEDNIGYIRKIHLNIEDGTKIETSEGAYWEPTLNVSSSSFFEDKDIYVEQIRNQIDKIVIAEIPDKELMNIWYETLYETTQENKSSQEGYQLLCERLDLWYQ